MKTYVLSAAAPMILILIFAANAISFVRDSEATTLAEKTHEMIAYVESEADQAAFLLAANGGIGTDDCKNMIGHAAGYYDAIDNTYAAAYDDTLHLISKRAGNVAGAQFDPFMHDEFSEAISRDDNGYMELVFEPGDGNARLMHLYFRWIPSGPDQSCLLIAAISSYTVQNSIKKTFYHRMIIITAIAAAVSVISSFVLHKALFNKSSDWHKIRERAIHE